MAIDEEATLGCGRRIDQVWANIENPPDAHESTCPDCSDARSRLDRLADATRDLRAADLADADLVPRRAVKANIMQIARAEVRRGRRLPLLRGEDPANGALEISEQAIAAVARATADRIPGIHARRCVVTSADDQGLPTTLPSPHPATISINLRVSVSAETQIPATVELLRTKIIDDVAEEIGLVTRKVDVLVEDVHDA